MRIDANTLAFRILSMLSAACDEESVNPEHIFRAVESICEQQGYDIDEGYKNQDGKILVSENEYEIYKGYYLAHRPPLVYIDKLDLG